MKNFLSEYNEQARAFLENSGAKMTISRAEIVDRFPGDEQRTGNRWKYRVRIDRNGKSYTFPFYDSIRNYEQDARPTKYDILACVEKYEPFGDVWDFANEYGYTVSSREEYKRVENIYKAVRTQAQKIERIFGDVLDELCEIC